LSTATPKRVRKELRPEEITAIVDSREQIPFNLSPLRSEVGSLPTADYSVRGLEHVVAIERKSLADLVACCGVERERFDREVLRLLAYPVRALIVEATWADLLAGDWRSKVKPASVIGSVLGWGALGLPLLLVGDHQRAGECCAKLLFIAARRRWREALSLSWSILEARAEEGSL